MIDAAVGVGPYAAHFGSDIRFGLPRDEFVFPAATLEQRCGVGGVAGEAVEASVVRYLGELESHVVPDFLGQARQAIRDLMLPGECTASRLASLFAVHRFTLHRHLQDLGISFAPTSGRGARSAGAAAAEQYGNAVGRRRAGIGVQDAGRV